MKQVSQAYLDGLLEGRAWFKQYGLDMAQEHLANLERTAKSFDAQNPVGQMLRGERDYWRNKLKRK